MCVHYMYSAFYLMQLTEIKERVLQVATTFDSLSQTSVIHDQQLIQADVTCRITNLLKSLSSTNY